MTTVVLHFPICTSPIAEETPQWHFQRNHFVSSNQSKTNKTRKICQSQDCDHTHSCHSQSIRQSPSRWMVVTSHHNYSPLTYSAPHGGWVICSKFMQSLQKSVSWVSGAFPKPTGWLSHNVSWHSTEIANKPFNSILMQTAIHFWEWASFHFGKPPIQAIST
jgi:hypothetical protein